MWEFHVINKLQVTVNWILKNSRYTTSSLDQLKVIGTFYSLSCNINAKKVREDITDDINTYSSKLKISMFISFGFCHKLC